LVKMPGKTPASVASAAKNVVSRPATQTPAMPPGTRYGRGACGWEYLSLMTEGKIRM
jgi:hypothetical protein